MRPVTVSVTGSPGSSPVIPVDIYQDPTDITLAVTVNGGITYSVQWTTDDVFSPTFNPATANWFAAAANLTGATTNQVGTLDSPVTGVQLITTAGGGTAQLRVIQGGIKT